MMFYLVRSLGSVLVTFFLHVEDSSLIIVVYRVGILVQSGLVRILWRGRRGRRVVGQDLVMVFVVWGAVDVVGRWRYFLVDQVGGGREGLREVGGSQGDSQGGSQGVAAVESGVWRGRQSAYQGEGQQVQGMSLELAANKGTKS